MILIMAGGLIQIAVYGTQDIFLTGSPQITFFKIVYRRHTNFAIESIQQHFLGMANFGQEMTCIVDKLGDLMNKVNLIIELPKVDLFKHSSNWKTNKFDAKQQFERIQSYYQMVYHYITINTNIIRKLDMLVKTNNIAMSDITNIMKNFTQPLTTAREQLQDYIAKNPNFDSIPELRNQKLDLIQQINRFDIQVIFNSIMAGKEPDLIKRKEITRIIQKMIYPEMKDFYMKAYTLFINKENIYKSFINGTYSERYNFAWVEEIGHSIIDNIEIQIGNQVIDSQSGDWLIVFNQISISPYQIKNYNKMIGNVKQLTIFNDMIKNAYILVIPFQFWFCRHVGLSLPLIALRYNDIIFNIKLKDLSKVCYVEETSELLDLPNIQSQYNINIVDAKLYIDYIFLDTDERSRFAKSTHEYLIETVQSNNFENIISNQYNAHMTFTKPTKFMIWFAQPNQYRENPSGYNKCQWNNFGTNPDKSGFTMKSAVIGINSCDRTEFQCDIKIFNYAQPYMYFKNSPTDGFNVYSFALKPLELQPSGTINLSRINDFSLKMSFTNNFLKLVNDHVDNILNGIHIGIFIMSYNILRIMGGMGGLAFA